MQNLMLLYKKNITALLMVVALVLSVSLHAQDEGITSVSGTITSSDDGLGLPGVNVLVVGTTTGATTDLDGNFTINASASDVLQFSFIGYTTQEITVGNQTAINVVLESDIAALSEVVVIGYGTQKKSNLTGSIAKVKNEQLDQIPVARADEALAGKMAGVQISNVNAGPGEAQVIKIRGASSLSANSNPLLVIDGVQVDGDLLGSIDMNDVESIEVLKDASSAAIYGSQAADGVIIITTKTGEVGKAKFSFNAYKGVKSAVFDHWNRSSSDEWMDGDYYQKAFIDSLGTSTNWFDEMVPGGSIESYALSASGGTERATYSVSGSYLNDEGILLTDYYKKYNVRASVNIKATDRIDIGLSIAPSATEKREFSSDMNKVLRQNEWLPIYHTEDSYAHADIYSDHDYAIVGDYAWESDYLSYPSTTDDDGNTQRLRTTGDANPMQYVAERDYTTNRLDLISSGHIAVKLAEGLKLKTQLSTTFTSLEDNDRIGVYGNKTFDGASTTMEYERNTRWLSETYLTYNKSIGNHDLNLLLGTSFQKVNEKSGEFGANEYESDYIATISSANTITDYSTEETNLTRTGVFARAQYAYANKYLASASYRVDGSSSFGEDTRYGYFPSTSVGWRVAQEDFMANVSVVSELKIKASYGSNGKDASSYSHLYLYEPTGAVFNGDETSTAYIPSQVGNSTLKWQESSEVTIGFDLGLMANRVYLSVEGYNKTTKDMLLDKEVSAVTGFETVTVNQGEVKNVGVDIELKTNNISTSDLTWSTSYIFSKYKTEIIDLGDGADSLIMRTEEKRGVEHIAAIGGEVSAFWGVGYAGELGHNEYEYYEYPIDNTSRYILGEDVNGDDTITNIDNQVLGSPNPKFTWSITNNVKYKDFDLSFTFLGQHGASVINVDPDYYEYGWLGETRDGYVQRTETLRNLSGYMVQDVSYISLRDVNFGYTIPSDLTQRYGVDNLRIYVAATNLGVWMMNDEYTGYNPNGNTGKDDSDENPLMQGYQNGSTPIAKTITVGVNLNF